MGGSEIIKIYKDGMDAVDVRGRFPIKREESIGMTERGGMEG